MQEFQKKRFRMATTPKKISAARSTAKQAVSRVASTAKKVVGALSKKGGLAPSAAAGAPSKATTPKSKESTPTKARRAKAPVGAPILPGKAASLKAIKPAGAKAKPAPPVTKPSKASPKTPRQTLGETSSGSDGLSVGAKAPAFSLKDQRGTLVTSASFKGKPYVLYFYPKDNTPGCTQEACDFRDDWSSFESAGVHVLGVSPDSEKSHDGFVSKYGLPFTLLSDPEKTLAQAYGAWGLKKNYGREFWGIVRSTFLVGSDGKIKRVWRNVRVNGHAQAVLAEARAL